MFLYGIYFSAYCGSLWLASLKVALTMAQEVGEHQELIDKLAKNLESAKEVNLLKFYLHNLCTYFPFRCLKRSCGMESTITSTKAPTVRKPLWPISSAGIGIWSR